MASEVELVTREDVVQDGALLPHLLIHGTGGDDIQHVVLATLPEAIAYAERLANDEGDSTARIFEMREIDISFKTYYHVELVSGGPTQLPPDDGVAAIDTGFEAPKVVAISA